MQYQAFDPSPELGPFVKCYWTLEADAESDPQRQRIVPDGCMEMIFHYGARYYQYLPDGTRLLQPSCFVIGQLTETLEIEPSGATGIFSVRFRPEGFWPFSSLPVQELENTAVALEQLFGAEGETLAKQVLEAGGTPQRIQLTEAFLLNQLQDHATVDRVVKTAVQTIFAAGGQLSIQELSGKTQVNRRQLERRFARAVGLSPKQLSRIIRLQSALSKLQQEDYSSLGALAHAADYYDQAHFIREFREFTGVSPREFYSDHLKMTAFFFDAE